MFCILMSVIAQLYLIPLISGRHGRPATKLPVRKIIKILSSKLKVLQLESRTFCVVTKRVTSTSNLYTTLPRAIYQKFPNKWKLLLTIANKLMRTIASKTIDPLVTGSDGLNMNPFWFNEVVKDLSSYNSSQPVRLK